MDKEETSPDAPADEPGASRGENKMENEGKGPGRDEVDMRPAKDSTGINPDKEEPIDPQMPHMPPA